MVIPLPNGYLLDTNIAIAFVAQDAAVQIRVREAQSVVTSSIVLGELYFGALNSRRQAENLARIRQFETRVHVRACDDETARLDGAIRLQLRTKGRPIPQHDVGIAATAVQWGFVLATRDGDFDHVEGLAVEHW